MRRALEGKRVLITRPEGQAEPLADRLRSLGAEPLVLPTIEVLPPENWSGMDEAIRTLNQFDWVVFTSVNGVRSFIDRMRELGVPISTLVDLRLAAIGPATAKALEQVCRPPDIVPNEFLSDAIPDAMGEVKGLRVLLPRADIARKALAEELRRRGATVAEVTAYRVQQKGQVQIANLPRPDYITLTSPSTFRSLARMLEEAGRTDWLSTVPLICIGPITANALRELGYQPARVAREHTIEGLIQAILEEAMCDADTTQNA